MKLEDERREYSYDNLHRKSLCPSPFDQFDLWMKQAIDAKIQDPTAMTVTTVGENGAPWSRIVLLKSLDSEGLCFYTGLESRKAKDIARNPRVSLHFPWLQMDRQVIAGGKAELLPRETAEAYFATRPRESQIAAWVSQQSSEIASRALLDAEFEEVSRRFEDSKVPTPEHWGGFRVIPEVFEFWQGGEHRLHDRFEYLRADQGNWTIRRLAP